MVYDWSNGKALWANEHPMDSQSLITKQAEMVLDIDPGVPGYAPRVWAYRNTIKALNWYSSVREKLDDPKYASWFIKFNGFSNTPYPGGQGEKQNGSFHVPTCDWYNNGTKPRCSGFYHVSNTPCFCYSSQLSYVPRFVPPPYAHILGPRTDARAPWWRGPIPRRRRLHRTV